MFPGPTVAFLFLLFFQTCYAQNQTTCAPSSCGDITNIRYPFRLVTDPPRCGDHSYNLSCENNSTILNLFSGKYYVKAINYNNFTIRLVDIGVQKENCSSFPRFPLSSYNFSLYGDPYIPFRIYNDTNWEYISRDVAMLTCKKPVERPFIFSRRPFPLNSSSCYTEIDHCPNRTQLEDHSHLYFCESPEGVGDECGIKQVFFMAYKDYNSYMSCEELHRELLYGFELYWYNIYCSNCSYCILNNRQEVRCPDYGPIVICKLRKLFYIDQESCSGYDPKDWKDIIIAIWNAIRGSSSTIFFSIGVIHGAKSFCGLPFVVGFLVYKWKRRRLSDYNTIEEFLQSNNDLMPIRYSYSDIKKMTENFKHKLGEGGFGSVYKGKLRSGHFAAVKMLSSSKTNGQDFVNEVITVGVIHHVNVVKLIGFCVEGSKRALIYDFMINGSLDRHIFSREASVLLSWTKLFDIALGVARGIEYLHQGCGRQILHFDIKPHNILLDENFAPKISDFGLSKLHTANQSIVSLTAARGTIGYMAPELFYKNIGNVSYKADVYSFGMLLLEMAGKRKNLNALAQNSSQIYFPFWVHDQISDGKTIEIGCESEEENLIAKKMIMVGLWCIQMQPKNRPSMKKVVEMLEGCVNNLQMPPKPLLYPEDTVPRDDSEASSSKSKDVTDSTSLMKSFNLEFYG